MSYGSKNSEMRSFLFLCLLINTDAVSLNGSSEYAVPGVKFRMICNTPEEAYQVQLYRRPNLTQVGGIQVGGGQCYNTIPTNPVVCTTDICSCTSTSDNYGTVFQWVIQPQTGDHGSVWYCRRNNPSLPSEADRVVDSLDYTLNVADGPGTVTLSPPDTTYTRTEGDTLPDITCTADCRPDCTFVWTKPDNTNFTTSPVLSLGQLDRSEHGTYRCTARNVVGELSTPTTVNILYGPSTLTLTPQDTTYTRTEGDTLPDITCAADCRPSCTFVWTKPDNTNFTASTVLSLGQLDRSEHGTYRCTARNVVGELSTSTTVNVLYGPTIVLLDPLTSSHTAIEGQALPTIRCSSDCNPACTYSWTKDGQSYTPGSDLHITNIQRSQAGVYRCTATNSYGSQTSSDITVTVNYGPGDSVLFQPEQDRFDKVENQTVPDIVCSADCEPACSFVWSKSGITYPNPLSVTIANRGNAGTYTCTASNSVSQTTKTWSLIVRFPPRMLSLGYTQGDADVTENGSKSLLCSVESYPPSIISWYYQNNTLLTNTDVLESTYTLAPAACLDTGMYTCSARNNISNIEVTKDIRINVLCKPRQDHRVEQKYSFGLATSETLTIRANFLSNPQPSFNWTFQSSAGAPVTLLANGLDNFGIQNIFEMNELSAVSVGTRSSIIEAWFGSYHVTASNSEGSGTLSFTAVAKGKPDRPKDGTVRCPNHDSAVLSWRSAFNGGSNQTFAVGMKTHQGDSFIIDKSLGYLDDPGHSKFINVTVSSLVPGTQHFFMVYAVNEFGNSSFEEEINCTTKGEPASDSSSLGPVIGGVCGALAAIIVVIVIIVIIKTKRRKTEKTRKDGQTEMITKKKGSEEDDSSDGMKPNVLYESSDGLKPNVLYESSGPQPGSSSEYAIVQKTSKAKPVSPNSLYAEVDKPKKGKADVTDLYAEVVKPKTKDVKAGKQKVEKTKKKDKSQTKKPNVGKVETAKGAYEKVDEVVGAEDGVYANCKDNPKTVSDIGPANRKNQDGLIYLDIKFQEEQQSGRNYVIHGIENRTDYADIDFKNHVDGSSQKKEDVQGTKDNKNS